jgi:hypothetical protein
MTRLRDPMKSLGRDSSDAFSTSLTPVRGVIAIPSQVIERRKLICKSDAWELTCRSRSTPIRSNGMSKLTILGSQSVVMKSSIYWDITPLARLNSALVLKATVIGIRENDKRATRKEQEDRGDIPPKRRFAFNGLQSAILQNIESFPLNVLIVLWGLEF